MTSAVTACAVWAMMRSMARLLLLVATSLLLPFLAQAQGDDRAYCNQLGALASRHDLGSRAAVMTIARRQVSGLVTRVSALRAHVRAVILMVSEK